MKNIRFIYVAIVSFVLVTACDNDLDQSPALDLEASNIEDYAPVLNAAYYYHTGVAMPQLVMGDFRADNMLMIESPFTTMDTYNADLEGGDMSGAFFSPVYSNLYKSILSANNVIDNSMNATQVAEAKFLRALSYFKLVLVFGDVTINLSPSPSISDTSILVRQPANDVYNDVIIPDFKDAIAGLTNSGLASGRASQIAARAFLGKVYMHRGDYTSGVTEFAAVVNGAAAAGITLEADFANVVTDVSSEIIFATQIAASIPNADGSTSASTFVGWFGGADTKTLTPLDPRLTAAFDASSAAGGGPDLRKALSIDVANRRGVKYTGGLDQDFIEMRLSDVILLYAEALNETGTPAATVLTLLDPIRMRAGLNSLTGTATTQADVRTAIANERRVELAMEGHRWFDLVRTGAVDAAMGETVNSNYYVFPIPNSEILATNGVITQNPGY
ncbi:RagB/SusD family nutrient uptake outer membrane protein [Gelidibacter salicanalis]|uniref:RagB/SusD family nutrient uptake outer membrane protein n=1 Tax=Gelidibacter salicanalis TaxID=291193 RepID=A0A934KK90_9FLAO|nr:RagB/SusD family nutrient uptake outer membrane protein [Gelidibacter salicanalis]MBJ7880612.1 RagB/SusD family nutrient uptake outer membrane protein [Gelidibacter salicanalis]